MAGRDNLHIVRGSFAAWNAHDVEGFVKGLAWVYFDNAHLLRQLGVLPA
jgi:hypothetical protein